MRIGFFVLSSAAASLAALGLPGFAPQEPAPSPRSPAAGSSIALRVVDPRYHGEDHPLTAPDATTSAGKQAAAPRTTAPFDATKALARCTAEEREAAPAAVRELLTGLDPVGTSMTPRQLCTILPGAVPNRPTLVSGTVSIGGRSCRCGWVFITAPLAAIRERERDLVAYGSAFTLEYSKVGLRDYAYEAEKHRWVAVAVDQYISVDWWPDPLLTVRALEQRMDGRVTVDYYLTCKYVTGKGRDVYYPVADDKGLYGYLIVTFFGYDDRGEYDATKVGSDIEASLSFMAAAGKS